MLEFCAVLLVKLRLGKIEFLIYSMRELQLEERKHGMKRVQLQQVVST